MTPGNKYRFFDLETYLQSNPGQCLLVMDSEGDCAMMHVFGGNFCGDWKSGDGILFYKYEQHSAGPDDLFTLLQIISI